MFKEQKFCLINQKVYKTKKNTLRIWKEKLSVWPRDEEKVYQKAVTKVEHAHSLRSKYMYKTFDKFLLKTFSIIMVRDSRYDFLQFKMF